MSVGRRVSTQAQNAASFTAGSQMNDIVGALFGEKCRFSQYRALGLNKKCRNCSHREPWAATNIDWLRNFFLKIGVFVLFNDAVLFGFCILSLLFGKDRTSAQRKTDIIGLVIMLGIAGFLFGSYFLYNYISGNYANKKDKEISKLPSSALPVLVKNGSPVVDVEALERIAAEQLAQIIPNTIEERKRKEVEEKRKEEERIKQETEERKREEIEESIKRATPLPQEKPVQQKDNNSQKEKNTASYIPYSAADEIEKFKGLLDKGIITQEEFDAKKKQLLEL